MNEILRMELGASSYDIIVRRGALNSAKELLNLDRKVLVVSDDGVPEIYSQAILSQCREGYSAVIPQGEDSKNLASFEKLLKVMLENGFTRRDCVVAVGGGVVGDLAGFAASAYMRGVDFYNIPTTVLSQVDSSIGGKTAVNLGSVKNIVGAFYQPKRVLIDTDLLKTLPKRQISNGLSEALKMALTFDKELFDVFENGDIENSMDEIILSSLKIKKRVVELDEREAGLRKTLNFGHTIGHGIESLNAENGLYHGECVALGMIPMCGENIRDRVKSILIKLSLPVSAEFDEDAVMAALIHDKKSTNGAIDVVTVPEIGTYEIKKMKPEEIRPLLSVIRKEAGG